MKDVDFQIIFDNFNEGNAALAHIDTATFIGNRGQASDAQADVVSRPGFLTQGPALSNLTNGNQAGVVGELIRFVMDKPVSSSITYAIGTGKLFKLSSTAVNSGGSPSWPQTVTNMTSGESVIRLKANIYGFYNKASGGDILKMPLSSETITANWGSATDEALESALHPVAVKEDIMLFGNGRYAGVYIEGLATLDVKKLDFGEGSEVADVVFHANTWYLAVNSGVGGRQQAQVYLYDGSALSNILIDEIGIGLQKIGWLYVLNGIIYICYQDLSSGAFAVGYIAGRQIKPLRYFTGSLPDHRQKTLYKNTILFASSDKLWTCGAVVPQLPIQISKLADGGYATLGAVAAPFGTPLVASTDAGSNFRLAKFSGYAVDSYYKTIFVDITQGKNIGRINTVIVITKPLGASAKCVVKLEGNQAGDAGDISTSLSVTTTGKTRHVFNSVGLAPMEDVRAYIDFALGDASNDCPIRKVILLGNYVER